MILLPYVIVVDMCLGLTQSYAPTGMSSHGYIHDTTTIHTVGRGYEGDMTCS